MRCWVRHINHKTLIERFALAVAAHQQQQAAILISILEAYGLKPDLDK